MKKLHSLLAKLKSMGLADEAHYLHRIIKMSSMPGIDHPTEETDIEGIGEVLKHLEKRENQTMSNHHSSQGYLMKNCFL